MTLLVENYDPDIHGCLIHAWHESDVDLSLFPEEGIVVNRKAMAFLYRTNSSVIYMDSFLCDPLCDLRELSGILDVLVDELSKLAAESGAKVVRLTTSLSSIARRVKERGPRPQIAYEFGWRQ